jgi:hypothetical protein
MWNIDPCEPDPCEPDRLVGIQAPVSVDLTPSQDEGRLR